MYHDFDPVLKHKGNEKPDSLTRQEAKTPFPGSEHFHGLPESLLETEFRI